MRNCREIKPTSSILYRIIRAGIGVFSLFGLTKVMFVPKTSDTTPPPPCIQPLKNKEIATLHDTVRHHFALFRLKICYCSWPPNLPTRLILVTKTNVFGGPAGKKARIVICCNFQDVHPDEFTASKTPGYPSLRMALSVASHMGWQIECWDVSTAFL